MKVFHLQWALSPNGLSFLKNSKYTSHNAFSYKASIVYSANCSFVSIWQLQEFKFKSCILKSHPLKWTKAEAIWKSLIPTQLKRLRWLHLFLWEKQTLLFRKGRRAIVHLPQLSAGRRQRKHEGMPGSSKNTTWSEPLNFSHFFGNLLIWCTLHLTVRTTSRFCQKT